MKTKLIISIMLLMIFISINVSAVTDTINAWERKHPYNVGGISYSVEFLYGSSGGPNTCGFWVTIGDTSYSQVSNSERDRVKPNGGAIAQGETYDLINLPLTFYLNVCGDPATFTLTYNEGGGGGEECNTHWSWKCENDIIYWYDACGNKEDIWKDCTNLDQVCDDGDISGECKAPCQPVHNYLGCFDGNVYWFNGCNEPKEQYEYCSAGTTCRNNQCVEHCISHSWKSCYQGDAWWRDSCNNYEEIAEECEPNERCYDITDECIPLCNSHSYKVCVQTALYWYDSCGYREEEVERCSYPGEMCTIEGCIPNTHCGDNICNYGETCMTCNKDCEICDYGNNFCGDGQCNENETCNSCSSDCGICAENQCDSNEDCNNDEMCHIGECKKNLCLPKEHIVNHECVQRETCTSNNDCEGDESCETGGFCEGLNCGPCTFISNHQCIDYECCSDSDCGGSTTCNTEVHACVEKSECQEVLINGGSNTKADILFVGDGYHSYEELKEDVLKLIDYGGNNGYEGLMSVEPFQSYKNRFNIWMLETGEDIPYVWNEWLEQYEPDLSTALSIATKCTSADYYIVISKENYRSYCYSGMPGGISFNSIGDEITYRDGRLILHEFGHGFARLADEYVEPDFGNRSREPNCAPNVQIATEWWGDLVGSEGVGYFEGCSYVESNIRPTKNSIMRSQTVLKDDYGPVNERKIKEVLSNYA
ncbi:MAG: hypothetical protein KKH88_00545 [Nanoarchaeota archaeon]|nr:hypothetical protein [Nanoarchaeota archaeon]